MIIYLRIEGLLKVGHTGKYIFKLESDGESIFYFNNRKIIDKTIRDIRWLNGDLIGDGTTLFLESLSSNEMFMVAG